MILSDIEGLFTADPHKDENAELIPVVRELTPDIYALAGCPSSGIGTGGMATKLRAAEIATSCGCDMVIADGTDPAVLYDIIEGKPVGTRFIGRKDK